jgi:hypothetical protein
VYSLADGWISPTTTNGPASTEDATSEPAPIVPLGNRNYQVGTKTVVVEEREDEVLQAFTRFAGKEPRWIPLQKQALLDQSGYPDAHRRLAHMKKKYPEMAPAIDCPGVKGRGGYKVRMQRPRKSRPRTR